MNTEQAIEYLRVDEMVPTSGCDYCDNPEGRRFIRYDEWEWENKQETTKIRSIRSEGDWSSRYDNKQNDEPIIGKQHQIHYYVCEKCLVKYANQLYDTVGKYVGNPETWVKRYFGDMKKTAEIRKTQVGIPVNMEKTW